jgi:membrane protease YdiL (CAAX protease family)
MIDIAANDTGPRPYGFFGLIVSTALIVTGTAAVAMGAYYAVHFLAGHRIATLLGNVGLYGTKNMHSAPAPVQHTFFVLLSAGFVALLIPTLLMALWRGGRSWRDLLALKRPERLPAGWWLVAFVLALPLYLIAASYTVRFFYPQFTTWFFVPADATGKLLSFIPVVILAPLAEELFFRGWLYTSLRNSFRPAVAIGVTTVIFALAHSDGGLLYPAAVFIPGLVLALVREYTGSALASFAAHALYNGWAWVLVIVFGRTLG